MNLILNFIMENLPTIVLIVLAVVAVFVIIKFYGLTKLREVTYQLIIAANELDGITGYDRADWVAVRVNAYLDNLPPPYAIVNIIPNKNITAFIKTLYSKGLDWLDDGEINNSTGGE
jgi:hypothetical protein